MTDLISPLVVAEARRLLAALSAERGYDSVTFDFIGFSESDLSRPTLYFTVKDDFQSGLSVQYAHRHKHGSQSIPWPFMSALPDWPSREERELRVLLAQQGESTALADEMRSASARRFVQNLCAERAEYARLVDFRPRGEREPSLTETLNDEIPF